jgi:hypothetical protein
MTVVCTSGKRLKRTDGASDAGRCRILGQGGLSGSLESSGLLAGTESWGLGLEKASRTNSGRGGER